MVFDESIRWKVNMAQHMIMVVRETLRPAQTPPPSALGQVSGSSSTTPEICCCIIAHKPRFLNDARIHIGLRSINFRSDRFLKRPHAKTPLCNWPHSSIHNLGKTMENHASGGRNFEHSQEVQPSSPTMRACQTQTCQQMGSL